MTVIEVDRLTKRFRGQVAVDDLSFAVAPGSITGLLGPNGAGKTTTLRTLLGLVNATSGSALIEGRPYRDLEKPLAAVGAVLENSGFYPGRTGRDNLRVVARSVGAPESRVDELLERVDLTEARNKRYLAYSLGMRQRLALVAALLPAPRILILDEPANGLDPQGIRWLRELLRSFASDGGTVLISSHVLAEISQTVEDVIVLSRGRLLAQAPLEELLAGPAAAIKIRTKDARSFVELLSANGIRAEVGTDERVTVFDTVAETVGDLAAAHAVPIYEMAAEGVASLEDVFLKLTGELPPQPPPIWPPPNVSSKDS
jgi:ABC-2 type transport system ATP-binding protein